MWQLTSNMAPVILVCWDPPLTPNRAGLCNRQGIAEMSVRDFQKLGRKRHCMLSLGSPRHEVTQAAPWTGLHGEERRPPANSQHCFASVMSEPT